MSAQLPQRGSTTLPNKGNWRTTAITNYEYSFAQPVTLSISIMHTSAQNSNSELSSYLPMSFRRTNSRMNTAPMTITRMPSASIHGWPLVFTTLM